MISICKSISYFDIQYRITSLILTYFSAFIIFNSQDFFYILKQKEKSALMAAKLVIGLVYSLKLTDHI